MPNYNDAQGVADLLSQFDFNIISEGPGDFSTQHRKYTCEFSKPGIESFTTTYQSNPDVHGQPTATDVFAALASDALAVDGRHIDDFADEAELGGWYTELMNAIGEGEPTFRECGTFTDHGFGFHAQDGTRTDYVIGWPFEDGGWAVLTGSYDLESDELADYHLPEDYLNGLLSRYGYSSLADFKSVNGETWRDALTGIIAGNQEANRFEVPHLFPDPSAAERFCTYQGVPGDLLRPAMEKARAEYEKVKAHQSPEKAVSLKGEVETARGASAAMADNGNHSNRGQDAR